LTIGNGSAVHPPYPLSFARYQLRFNGFSGKSLPENGRNSAAVADNGLLTIAAPPGRVGTE
jgi:hypothetical protein